MFKVYCKLYLSYIKYSIPNIIDFIKKSKNLNSLIVLRYIKLLNTIVKVKRAFIDTDDLEYTGFNTIENINITYETIERSKLTNIFINTYELKICGYIIELKIKHKRHIIITNMKKNKKDNRDLKHMINNFHFIHNLLISLRDEIDSKDEIKYPDSNDVWFIGILESHYRKYNTLSLLSDYKPDCNYTKYLKAQTIIKKIYFGIINILIKKVFSKMCTDQIGDKYIKNKITFIKILDLPGYSNNYSNNFWE